MTDPSGKVEKVENSVEQVIVDPTEEITMRNENTRLTSSR